jgi:hypothetical protein
VRREASRRRSRRLLAVTAKLLLAVAVGLGTFAVLRTLAARDSRAHGTDHRPVEEGRRTLPVGHDRSAGR